MQLGRLLLSKEILEEQMHYPDLKHILLWLQDNFEPSMMELKLSSKATRYYYGTPHCCLALVQNLHALQGSLSNSIVGRYSGQAGYVSAILDSPSALAWFFAGRCCMTILHCASSSIHLAN
jgi:hypothetical protein